MRKPTDGKNGNHEIDGKAASHNSQTSHDSPSLILPPRGDYPNLAFLPEVRGGLPDNLPVLPALSQ